MASSMSDPLLSLAALPALNFCKNSSIYHPSWEQNHQVPQGDGYQPKHVNVCFLSTLTTEFARQEVIQGFSLSIPHSIGRALDLLKHFKTPARSLSAGEARKVRVGFVFAAWANPARSSLGVVHRKPSAEWVLGIICFHQYLLNPAWQDSHPPLSFPTLLHCVFDKC